MAVRGVSVQSALEEWAELTGVSLVYSSDVVAGRRTVCRLDAANAEELLRCIVDGAGLDFYRLSSGTYVVIRDPAATPAYGTITGRVLDAVTGEPIPLARVELTGSERRILADGGGSFVLPRMLPGAHQLTVSGFGYAPRSLPIRIGAAESVLREVRLDPEVIQLGAVVVDGLRAPGPRSASSPLAGPGDVMPSSIEGSAALRSSVGLARRPLFAELSLQGGAPGEHVVRLDGAPVYDPVALGRSRSAFSPLALRRIRLSKAGFSVKDGSYASGLVDVEHAVSDATGPGGVGAFADPWSSSVGVSLPLLAFGGEGSMMFSGRRSNWDVFREPALDQAIRDWNRVDPVLMGSLLGDAGATGALLPYTFHGHGADVGFSDVHGALRLSFPGFRSVNASFYRGTNRFGSELFASGTAPGSSLLDRLVVVGESYDWSNLMAQAGADWLVGSRASMAVRSWYSEHELVHDYAMADGSEVGYDPLTSDVSSVETALRARLDARPPTGEGNRIEEIGATLQADFVASPSHVLSGGVEAIRMSSRAHLDNDLVASVATHVDSWRLAGFVSDEWRLPGNLTLEGGLRVTSVGGGGTFAEPRLSLQIDGESGALGTWSARAAGGVYRQFVEQFDLTNVGPSALVPSVRFWVPSDGSVEPSRSRHLAFEFVATPATEWEVRAEAYHKSLTELPSLDFGVLTSRRGGDVSIVDQSEFIASAEGEAYGAGARVGWSRGRAKVEGGYDWSVSERTFPSRFDGARQPAPWSEPHRWRVLGRVPVVGGWAVDTESTVVRGRSWALRRAYYDFLAFHDQVGLPAIGVPGEDLLPTLYRVDAGVSWLGRVGEAPAEFRFEVLNVQSRQVLDYSLAADPTETSGFRRVPRFLPGRSYLISMRIAL